MRKHLIEFANEASEALRKGNFRRAIDLYELIVAENPGWEHGEPYYNLTIAHQELGNFDIVELNYRETLKRAPGNPYFLDAFAEFNDQCRGLTLFWAQHLKYFLDWVESTRPRS